MEAKVEFERTFSGAPWEVEVGYCRALKAGNRIFITGTAPVGEGGVTYAPGDAYAQTWRCLEIIQKALDEFGETMRAVVRTRMYVTDISKWREFGRAHKEIFSQYPPATTMVEVSSLIQPDMLIEIEVDAISDRNVEAV
jgi:isochorismate pyruvate lyase